MRGPTARQGALVLLAFLPVLAAEFLVEKGTLKYTDSQGHSQSVSMALANFGKPLYGATTRGTLVYPKTSSLYPHQCRVDEDDVDCAYGCVDFVDKAIPALDSAGQPLAGVGSSEMGGAILLIDRGPQNEHACKFTLKAWNAQKVKASAILIVNYEDKLTTMDKADDEDTEAYIQNLTIPAGFIKKTDGDKLKAMLVGPNGNYAAFEDFKLQVALSWEDILPRQETVSWEFWTNSNDACGSTCDSQKAFIKSFAPHAKEMSEEGVAQFSPHYLVWVCPAIYRDTQQCLLQCIYGGKYCCPDPEDDMEAGYDGKDVILENLRQLCVFKIASAPVNNKSYLWWDYNTKFAEQCKMSEKKYNAECAEKVFKELGGESLKGVDGLPDGLNGLRECVGDPESDGDNKVLEMEKDAQVGNDDVSEVSILPTVRINGAQYRGALEVMPVMRALCSAFPLDQEPESCNGDVTMAPNECELGAAGDQDCKSRDDGKTKCINTFSSYYCDCGAGWVAHTQGDESICLDLNECKYLNPADLGEACTCDRCACHNQKGGFSCEADIADECAGDSDCWSETIAGVTFSACVDLIDEYKTLAQEAKATDSTPLHKCECPVCFEGDGKTCKKVNNFQYCDKVTGFFNFVDEAGDPVVSSNKSTLSVGSLLLIIISAIIVAVVAAYAVFRLQRRSHMDAEIRAIMAQYMPLDKAEDEANGQGGAHRVSSPRNGAGDTYQRMV